MTFLHPALLAAGLACIAIPIIIHLLMHRRRKPVMWGAMRFLLEAYKRQRRRIMLEKWLLLACRVLLIALVALAIGRPLLGRLAPGKPGKTIYILIDNSLTSGVRDASGATALSRHKQAAKQVLKSLRSLAASGSEADRVGLISLGGPAEGLVVPASANLGSVETLIDAVEATDSKADFPGALTLLSGSLSPVEGSGLAAPRPDRSFVVLLSDYLDGSLDLAATSTDASQSLGGVKLPDGVRLISSTPSTEAASNISITALEPLRSVLVDAAKGAGATGNADLSELVRIICVGRETPRSPRSPLFEHASRRLARARTPRRGRRIRVSERWCDGRRGRTRPSPWCRCGRIGRRPESRGHRGGRGGRPRR